MAMLEEMVNKGMKVKKQIAFQFVAKLKDFPSNI
jgi:hypothetical protein